MYNTAGVTAASGVLAATGLAVGHYAIAILALIAAGEAVRRGAFGLRRRLSAQSND